MDILSGLNNKLWLGPTAFRQSYAGESDIKEIRRAKVDVARYDCVTLDWINTQASQLEPAWAVAVRVIDQRGYSLRNCEGALCGVVDGINILRMVHVETMQVIELYTRRSVKNLWLVYFLGVVLRVSRCRSSDRLWRNDVGFACRQADDDATT